MERFRRLIFTAALAGAAAGLFGTAMHQVATVPLIALAEVYERAADAPGSGTPDAAPSQHHHGSAEAGHDHAVPGPVEPQGFRRALYTALADVVTGVGFALLLTAAMELRGTARSWHVGLAWGLAGYVAFSLAPGLGLPPELPGTEAAPLAARQIWWAATAAATAGGLALIFLARHPLAAVIGLVLVGLPHLVGAPLPSAPAQAAPEALAQGFAATVRVTALFFWAALGAATGFFADLLGRKQALADAHAHLRARARS